MYTLIARSLRSRIALVAVSAVYSALLVYAIASYAGIEWTQYGYSFGEISFQAGLLIGLAVASWSAVLPLRLQSGADVILLAVYMGVCIPAVVVPLSLERTSGELYHLSAVTVIAGFALTCLAVRKWTVSSVTSPSRKCSHYLIWALVLAWAGCLAVLVGTYGSVMKLVSLDAIYDQREAGAATSRFMGYIQTYFGYVLSPALIAFGLTERRWLLVLLGIAGGVVLYSITAEKNAFAFPFLILALNFALTRRARVFQSSAFILGLLAVTLALSIPFYDSNLVAGFIAWYIGLRSLLTPGLFVAQYQDFFSAWGYTHLSQVTGIGLLVPPPPGPGSNERWPSLGHLVGEQYLGIPTLNANASFLATDGIASFGVPGILLAFALLAMFLIAFQRTADAIPPRFVGLIALPIGLTLTNVSLFTVVLSFGGLFWLIIFALCFRSGAGTRSLPSAFRVS
jgi:hypothetical protein